MSPSKRKKFSLLESTLWIVTYKLLPPDEHSKCFDPTIVHAIHSKKQLLWKETRANNVLQLLVMMFTISGPLDWLQIYSQ